MAAVQRHPMNTGFEWTDHSGPFNAITKEQAASFDELGYFVFEDALDSTTLKDVLAEIDPWEERATASLRKRGGKQFIADADAITFTVHLVKRSSRLRELVSTGILRDIAHDIVGPDVRMYWDQAVYKKPEKVREFPWHQDNGYTFVEPQEYLTCWIALTDASSRNGCPVVVPKLHRMGTLKHWLTDWGWQCVDDPADTITAEVRAGSIVVFSSLTPHKTGANMTDEVRKAYIVQYAPEGAEILREADGQVTRELANDPDRQFPVP
jgi:ectoine hydroxylase-related dioxygenase (phytanoyl-CoA dioxygenase family)